MGDYERAAALFVYDPETGFITRRVARGTRWPAGSRVGCIDITCGYRMVHFGPRQQYEHRLAWLLAYGEWPDKQVDHINGKRDDNRLANLRLATNTENQRNARRPVNNTSGYKGVHWESALGKWRARITVDRKCLCLGLYERAEDAHAAYVAAAKQHHGEFANDGVGE